MENPKRIGGRPRHDPTPIGRRLVEVLVAEGIPQAQICSILSISEKTLRRHYKPELRRGSTNLEAALVLHLFRLANGKGAVALRAVKFILKARFGWSEFLPPPR